MQRLASSLLILALAVTIPARASQVAEKHDKAAKSAAVAAHPAKVKVHKPFFPAFPTIITKTQTSSKGARVVAFTVIPTVKPAARKSPVKATAAAVVAAKPAPANGAPAANTILPQSRLARITCYYT
jgi:hypothetical protein